AAKVFRFDPVREDDVPAQPVDPEVVCAEDLPRGAAIFACTGDAGVRRRAIALRGSSIRRTSGGRGCAFGSRLVPRDERSARGSSREQTSRNPTYRPSHLPHSRVAANLRRVSAGGNDPRSHALARRRLNGGPTRHGAHPLPFGPSMKIPMSGLPQAWV